tara:strand:+ start:2103 stop:2747 length:645 start_codon:yes stop_codon:yes gene_type:complete
MRNASAGFIVVEGPIGVGKTTLAKKLANSLGYDIFLEEYKQNPFLVNFYSDVEKYALGTQLFFLLQRAKDFNKSKISNFKKNIVSDFFIQKDKIFAQTTLNDKEFDLYLEISNSLDIFLPSPDLVIYLQANHDTLVERIRTRANNFEKNISSEYLKKINDAYTSFFYSYKESPLLIINTSRVNVHTDNDYSLLLKEIKRDLKGKNFFNPISPKE